LAIDVVREEVATYISTIFGQRGYISGIDGQQRSGRGIGTTLHNAAETKKLPDKPMA
jgi:hypothetical protein